MESETATNDRQMRSDISDQFGIGKDPFLADGKIYVLPYSATRTDPCSTTQRALSGHQPYASNADSLL